MKTLLTIFLFGILCYPSLGQENEATALNLDLTNYLEDTGTGVGCTALAGNLGASGSGVPTCSGTDSDDAWYVFTAQTQAAKFVATAAGADLVLEVLNTGNLASISCSNASGAGAGETLRVSGLTAGQTYYLRIHSTNGAGGAYTVCGQFYPASKVRDGWHPVPSPDIGLPGFRVNEAVNRDQYAPNNGQIQATRWQFTDINTLDEYTFQVNGTNSVLNLNAVGGLCFGTSYDVLVQVQVDGYWCGYGAVRQIIMEAAPTTELEPGYAGQNYDLNDDLKARFVGAGQSIQWRLTTDNGMTEVIENSAANSSYLYFDQTTCLRYNRIYTVEIRAFYCGVWGPWSTADFIITNPIPYVNVRPQFCNTTQFPGATLQCDFLPIVDSYAWQISPIETGDVTMTPVGPAIVAYSVNTSLYLLPLGLTFGQSYRVGAKPLLGTVDACNDPQEGDYGYFCPILIGNPNAVLPDYDYRSSESESIFEQPEPEFAVFPNPIRDGIANLDLRNANLHGDAWVIVHNMAGRELLRRQVNKIEDASFLQLGLPAACTAGMYLISVMTESTTLTTRALVQ